MFFFRLVTFDRRPMLVGDTARRTLHEAIAACGRRWPFALDAAVLLPDHLHAIWTLPPGEADFLTRWAFIERRFTAAWLGEDADAVGQQQRWARRRSVWQPRFYEHVIRDEDDRDRLFDYLHYNPVKHGYASCPHIWPWSSFARCVEKNIYPADWSCSCGGAKGMPPDLAWGTGWSRARYCVPWGVVVVNGTQ